MLGVTGLHLDQLKMNFRDKGKGWAYFSNYGFWVFSWVIGHLLGGIFFFGLLGWLGSLFSKQVRFYAFIVLIIICIVGALHQLKVIQIPFPQIKRQVSRLWLVNLHKNFVAFGYGFQLGSSVATRIKVATTYIVIGISFCLGSVIYGVLLGALFGLSRSILPIILASISGSPDKSLIFALKFNSYDSIVQRVNGVMLVFTALAISYLVLTPTIQQFIK